MDRDTMNILRDLISQEELENIENIPRIQTGIIDYIFLLTRADSPNLLSDNLDRLTGVCHKHSAVVQSVIGPMIIAAFGTIHDESHPSDARTKLVKALCNKFPNELSIVHGVSKGSFGIFGGSARCTYSFDFPQFRAALAELGSIKFGEVKEMGNESTQPKI